MVDPFCGRGTAVLESRLCKRRAFGSDLNPISIALTRAKAVQVDKQSCFDRLGSLENSFDLSLYLTPALYQPEEIKLLFHPHTLAQLIYLSKKLSKSDLSVDSFLLAALLGVLHGGERKDGSSAYASIAMPNTFSMSVGYVRKYVSENHLEQKSRNVFDLLKNKVSRASPDSLSCLPESNVFSGDAKSISEHWFFTREKHKAKLIIGSPPYLNVVNYAKQNWIRMWLMRRDLAEVDESLDDNHPMGAWLNFMELSVLEFKKILQPDGVIALIVGDVVRGGNAASPARELLRRLIQKNIFAFYGCISDDLDVSEKVTRIWSKTKGSATAVDRVLILSDRRPQINSDWINGSGISGLGDQILNIDQVMEAAEDLVGFEIYRRDSEATLIGNR